MESNANDGVRLERKGGLLGLRTPECRFDDWRLCLEADGRTLLSTEATEILEEDDTCAFILRFKPQGVDWAVRVDTDEHERSVRVRSSISNTSPSRIALGKVSLMDSPGPVLPDADWREVVNLSLAGELFRRPIYRMSDPECPRTSKIKVQLFDRRGRRSVLIGFLTFRKADTVVACSCSDGQSLSGLTASCDYAGYGLEPGECVKTEEFSLSWGSDPVAQLTGWADEAARLNGARSWEEPPIGWLGWSWVDPLHVERYEDAVLRNAAAIERRLRGYGVGYVWVSLGNLRGILPGDWLAWNYELFPNGPEYLGRKLGEHGLRWGLWCGAFYMSPMAPAARNMEDALLRRPDGTLLVVRPPWPYGVMASGKKEDRPSMYGLDPSHPKTLEHLSEVFRTYRTWGVRYYMLDFLQAASGNIGILPYGRHFDRRLVAGPEAYHRGLEVIRAAAGDDTYFLSSSGPSVHNTGAVDAARTGNDFGEGRPLQPGSYFYPATFVINSGGHWTGPQYALQNQATAFYTHRRLYLNDSGNVLTVDKPLPLNAAQIHATIHGLSGGPTMIGDDIDRLDEERLGLIRKTLPRVRDAGFPVDLYDSVHPDHPKVFHRRIERPWGSYDVVAVYNFSDDLLRQPIDLRALGLSQSAAYLVWEFWNCEYVGRISGRWEARIPPASVRVFRLAEDQHRPVLLGTDMHLLMGEVEILSCTWDPVENVLAGRAVRPGGEVGSVFIHAPATVRVTNPAGLWVAKDGRDGCLVIRVRCAFTEGSSREAATADSWSLRFAPLEV